MEPHWELTGRPESALFFRRLLDGLPTATTLFVEGTTLAPDVSGFLRSAIEPGDYLPKRQTLLPRPKQFRLRFDHATLDGLAALAERHADPELLDHLFVYNSANALLEYPDAFVPDCPILVSVETDEQRIRSFAAALALKLARAPQPAF